MPDNCPLKPHVDAFLQTSQSLKNSIRTLREEFSKCPGCPEFPTCALRDRFRSRINTAVSELSEEWNLVGSL